MNDQLPKGALAEEALRNYFIGIGYLVFRGCRFRFRQFDVTDIDLFLYGKSSPLSRERINVDIKNKRTPQALERVFWAKGLQSVLGFEGAMVATTDPRPDVGAFGHAHNVRVLDGRFLSRLTKSNISQLQRISEAQLSQELDKVSLGKLGGDWRGRYEKSKGRLLTDLNFDGCNAWLQDIEYFVGQINGSAETNATVRRMIYLITSHLLTAIDYILTANAVADQEQRRTILEAGFRYGVSGQEMTEKVGRMAAALAGSLAMQPEMAETARREFSAQAVGIRADVLAEFFAKAHIQTGLFDTARELEQSAFAPSCPNAVKLSGGAQSVLGVISDFLGIDRKRVIA